MKKPNTETTAGCLLPGQRFWVEMVCDGDGQNGTVVVYPVPQDFNANGNKCRFRSDAPVLIQGEASEFEVPDEYKWIVPGAECVWEGDKWKVASTPFYYYGGWNCYLSESLWRLNCKSIAKVEVIDEPITLTLSKKDAVALQELLSFNSALPHAAAVLSKELNGEVK